MACACGSKGSTGPTTYQVALPGGRVKVYSSQPAAEAEVKKVPGAYLVPQQSAGTI